MMFDLSAVKRVPALPVLAFFILTSLSAFAQQTASQTVDVGIAEYRYSPAEVRIKVGDTVRWTNKEKRTSHSVLFPGNPSLESERMFRDESWSRTFDKPGEYPYICGPHPEMRGLVVVSE